MLGDHTNSGRDGLGRAPEGDALAAQADVSVVAGQEAIENVHQRRFACAVLADQRVDLSGPDRERCVVYRHQLVEALGDMRHLHDVGANFGHVPNLRRDCGVRRAHPPAGFRLALLGVGDRGRGRDRRRAHFFRAGLEVEIVGHDDFA